MGTPTWPKLPDLIDALLADASGFELYQALRLVESLWSERGKLGGRLDRWVRVLPSRELSFPAADLRSCEMDADGRLELRARCFGLYGVDAPMPHYFLEEATFDRPGSQSLRDFLDVFNRRFYVLMYQAWRVQSSGPSMEKSAYGRTVAALAGCVGEEDGERLPHAGLFGQRVRSAAGLQRLLARFLGDLPVEVRDRIPQWVAIERDGRLGGEGFELGGDSLLGDRILVAGGRIEIRVGPITVTQAQGLLPGGRLGGPLTELAEHYLEKTVDFDLGAQRAALRQGRRSPTGRTGFGAGLVHMDRRSADPGLRN